MISTCISEPLESPDEFDDVEDTKESRVSKVPEVIINVTFAGKCYMLEHNQSDEGNKEHDKEYHVPESSSYLMKESLCVT